MSDETALVIRTEALVVTAEQVELVRRTVAADATPDELKLYLYDCARRGTHPLDKKIHFTKRQGKYTPVVGIDYMRTTAAETGECAGIDDAVFAGDEPGPKFAATVTVYRMVKDQPRPFTATARWPEYYPGDAQGFMWRKMPHTMLAKCAEALALRKGFPTQLSGLYSQEEMAQAGRDEAPPTVTVQHPTPAQAAVHRQTVQQAVQKVADAHVMDDGPSNFLDPERNVTDDGAIDAAVVPPPAGLCKITKVKPLKKGSNAKGPWTLWVIGTDDGREGTTFSNDIALAAEDAMQYGTGVEVVFIQSDRDTSKMVVASLLKAAQ